MPTRLRPTATFTLPDTVSRKSLVAFNVGPDGTVYLLSALKPLDYRTPNNGFAIFAKTVPEASQDYRLVGIREGVQVLDLLVRGEIFNIHDVQPLQDELVLACGRSEYRGPQDFELNGRVYNQAGEFQRAVLLGDGIATMQATTHGELWTSYYDEGVFGNFGWNEPIGASGLVAWDSLGRKLYEFDPEGRAQAIVDCYALNVASSADVWCYYYSSFQLVHIRERKIAGVWSVPIRGSSAFAVAKESVLFFGAHKGDSLLRLVRLTEDGKASVVEEFDPCEDDGTPVKAERVVGRAGALYGLSERGIFQIDLLEVTARLGK